jgi:hypothetical protein
MNDAQGGCALAKARRRKVSKLNECTLAGIPCQLGTLRNNSFTQNVSYRSRTITGAVTQDLAAAYESTQVAQLRIVPAFYTISILNM